MPLSFRGTAHGPPARKRDDVADLSAAEIATTQMGLHGGTDLLVEHDHNSCVGTVHTSWEGRDGSLRVAGVVRDPKAIALVQAGRMRGLSLGTELHQTTDGQTLLRTQDELSLCARPRRGGCYIDTIDGQSVRNVSKASEKGALYRYPAVHKAVRVQSIRKRLRA